jgi:hypothetical protein
MKKLTLVGLFVGTLAVGATVGAWAGAWWSARVYGRMAFAKPEIELAFHAAQEAEWAAELRLNDAKSTIADLENFINIQVATIARWDDLVAPPDEQTRKARDRFLTSVKVYQQSYAASGSDAARINALLSTVPGRNPQSPCKSGICQLDDLRLAKLHTITTSP